MSSSSRLISVPEAVFDLLLLDPARGEETPENHAISLILKGLPKKCLVPSCPQFQSLRGLCRKHFDSVKYYKTSGALNESWLVLHKRILPRPGEDLLPDSLETLPRVPQKRLSPDLVWLFDWPNSVKERERLEREHAEKEKT